MEEPIDMERFRRGSRQLSVSGHPEGAVRQQAIEDAISLVQQEAERSREDGKPKALVERYIGVKNYASFGDQREDHAYGRGPRHGTIVFRIGRKHPDEWFDVDSAVYFLECVRDAGMIEFEKLDGHKVKGSLQDAWNYANALIAKAEEISAAINDKRVESSL